MYAEIAMDVMITAVTAGGGAVLTGVLKGARATRSAKHLITSIKTLTKLDDVKKYLKSADITVGNLTLNPQLTGNPYFLI